LARRASVESITLLAIRPSLTSAAGYGGQPSTTGSTRPKTSNVRHVGAEHFDHKKRAPSLNHMRHGSLLGILCSTRGVMGRISTRIQPESAQPSSPGSRWSSPETLSSAGWMLSRELGIDTFSCRLARSSYHVALALLAAWNVPVFPDSNQNVSRAIAFLFNSFATVWTASPRPT